MPSTGKAKIFIIIKETLASIKLAKGPAKDTKAWSLSKLEKFLESTGTAFIQPITGMPVTAASKGNITLPSISI